MGAAGAGRPQTVAVGAPRGLGYALFFHREVVAVRYRSWMWAEAVQVIERAERLHRQFFQCTASGRGLAWEPPVDIFETEVGLVVLVALPGVPPEEVRLEMEGGVLRVTGMRTLPALLREATIQRLEIPHGRFERRIELPPGVYQAGGSEFANGCLVISLRKGGR